MYWLPPLGATHGELENEPIIIDITSITIVLLTCYLSTYLAQFLRRIINLGSSSHFLVFFFWLQIIFDCKFMPNFKVVTNRLSPIIANNLVSLDDLKPHSDKALSFICQLFGTPTAINSPESGAFITAQCLLSFRFHFTHFVVVSFWIFIKVFVFW